MTFHQNVGTKRNSINENSAYLSYKHLGYISKKGVQRLVNNEILPNLGFTSSGDCNKHKQTKYTMKGAKKHSFLNLYTLVYVVILTFHLF